MEKLKEYSERDIQIYRCNKGAECISPDTYGCIGCKNNLVPDLYDGGCRLLQKHIEELRALERIGRGKTARALLKASNSYMVRAYKEAPDIATGIEWKKKELELERKAITELKREIARCEGEGVVISLQDTKLDNADQPHTNNRKNQKGDIPIYLL